MSRKSRHNLQVRARIIQGAGRAFRAHGYGGVGIDGLMAEANLTRGAFYAHFPSKAALFTEVVRSDHPLLTLLENRSETGENMLWQTMHQIFKNYLSPELHDRIAPACSMAALVNDTGNLSADARIAYAQARHCILNEMVRGQHIQPDNPAMLAALTLAAGSVAMAAALEDLSERAALLNAGHTGFVDLVENARKARH